MVETRQHTMLGVNPCGTEHPSPDGILRKWNPRFRGLGWFLGIKIHPDRRVFFRVDTGFSEHSFLGAAVNELHSCNLSKP